MVDGCIVPSLMAFGELQFCNLSRSGRETERIGRMTGELNFGIVWRCFEEGLALE